MDSIPERNISGLSTTSFPNRFFNNADSITQSSVREKIALGNLSHENNNTASLLNLVAASFGTALHKYIGNETVSFLLKKLHTEQSCTTGRDKEFKIVQIHFNDDVVAFDDVLQQVKRCSKILSFSKLRSYSRGICDSIVKFIITNAAEPPVVFDGLKLQELCQLYIRVQMDKEAKFLELELTSTKFEETKLKRLTSHVNNILKEGIQQSEVSLSELKMISPREELKILCDFNKILPENAEFWNAETNLFELFYKNVVGNGSKLAIVQQVEDYQICLSYSELFSKVNCLAAALKQLETVDPSSSVFPTCSDTRAEQLKSAKELDAIAIQCIIKLENRSITRNHNTFIALLLPRSLVFVASSLSTLMIGKTVAPLHYSYALKQVEGCLAILGNPILISTKTKIDEIGLRYDKILFVDEDGSLNFDGNEAVVGLVTDHVEYEANINKTPYCFFTSGSTGQPKAVLINQATILNEANFTKEENSLDNSIRTMCIASPGFIPSLYDPWFAWLVGGSVYIPSEETKTNIRKLLTWIHKQEITCFYAPAVLAEQLLNTIEDEEIYLPKLKFITLSGGRLCSLDLRHRKFNCRYMYGTTETYGICINTLRHGQVYHDISVWVSLPNVKVYVLDPSSKLVPIGVTGEVYVSGVGVMAGYLNRNDSCLLPNPFETGKKMYRTGDIGYFTKTGELYLQGRKDQQVKIHGMRLELGEVESAIQNVPGISQAVVQIRLFENTQNLVAYVKPTNPDKYPTEAEIKLFLTSHLQRHAVPAEIKFVDAFALTPSGKLHRNGPVKLLMTQPPINTSLASETFTEIKEIWGETLEIPQEIIHETSDFFALVGNSLHASKLTHRLCNKFPKVQLSKIYQFPVISDFVKFLETDILESSDTNFENEIKFDINMANSFGVRPKTIKKSVLTGATGYFGSALLVELLTKTDQNVVCIIRAPNTAEAKKRLEAALLRNKFTSTIEELNGRLQVVAGDLSYSLFGLMESTYIELSNTTNAIYHAAAEVDHMKTYNQLKHSTKSTMKNVIEFAACGKLKWIHHVSTMAVFDGIFQADESKQFAAEDFLTKNVKPEHMRNGYAQSKWVSEGLLRNALDAGIPGAIYRLGQVGCHSSQPIINAEDSLASFLKICKKLACFPNVQFTIPYVSLDSAAKMLVDHSESVLKTELPVKRVLHIIEAHICLQDFLQRDKGQNYKPLSLSSWEREFNTQDRFHSKEEVGALAFLNWLKSGVAGESQVDGLAKRKFSCYQNSASKLICKSELALKFTTNLFNLKN